MVLADELLTLKEKVQNEIDTLKKKLIMVSLGIFKHPQVKFEEKYACARLCRVLRREKFKIQRPVAGMKTAFVATAPSKKKNARPRVVFLCEYDALPEIGHACGHNLISTASLGAAVALARVGYPGTIVVMGTPGEEGGGGKQIMIEHGIFKGIDAALMFHPFFGDKVGGRMMAIQEIEVTFRGRAAHAALRPEDGINALDAVISVFNSMNALRQHIRDDARLHGIITEGGVRPNIVPDRAVCLFSIRAQEQGYLNELIRKFRNAVKAAELATGAKAEVKYGISYKTRKINMVLADVMKKNLVTLGRHPVGPTGEKGLISSDFGNVSWLIPGAHPLISIGQGLSLHTKEFAKAARSKVGQQTMILAAKALAMTAIDLAMEEGLMDRVVKAQHKAKDVPDNTALR